MANKAQPIEPRFWANVLKKRGCWEWKACKMTRGYGQLSWNGKCVGAHIVSVIISGREIPKGHVVMHKCDNKGCVNPSHLVVVPHKVNMIDFKNKRLAHKKAWLDGYKEGSKQAELKRKERRKADTAAKLSKIEDDLKRSDHTTRELLDRVGIKSINTIKNHYGITREQMQGRYQAAQKRKERHEQRAN